MVKEKLNPAPHYVRDFSELPILFEPVFTTQYKKRKRVRRDTLFYLGRTKVRVKKKYRPSFVSHKTPLTLSRSRPSERAVACSDILCR